MSEGGGQGRKGLRNERQGGCAGAADSVRTRRCSKSERSRAGYEWCEKSKSSEEDGSVERGGEEEGEEEDEAAARARWDDAMATGETKRVAGDRCHELQRCGATGTSAIILRRE